MMMTIIISFPQRTGHIIEESHNDNNNNTRLVSSSSLSSSSSSSQLYQQQEQQQEEEKNTLLLYTSTVWGPTCDGLDRVCRDIALPELHRDDWLLFPIQCSNGEGLGTGFNGFCPPDTAYCVLGYFRD